MTYTLYPQPGYPFLLGFELTYALGPSGLTVHATATNLGDRACPYGAGFHPYLRLDPASHRLARAAAPRRPTTAATIT